MKLDREQFGLRGIGPDVQECQTEQPPYSSASSNGSGRIVKNEDTDTVEGTAFCPIQPDPELTPTCINSELCKSKMDCSWFPGQTPTIIKD